MFLQDYRFYNTSKNRIRVSSHVYLFLDREQVQFVSFSTSVDILLTCFSYSYILTFDSTRKAILTGDNSDP